MLPCVVACCPAVFQIPGCCEVQAAARRPTTILGPRRSSHVRIAFYASPADFRHWLKLGFVGASSRSEPTPGIEPSPDFPPAVALRSTRWPHRSPPRLGAKCFAPRQPTYRSRSPAQQHCSLESGSLRVCNALSSTRRFVVQRCADAAEWPAALVERGELC